jgi:hypothetical protein
VEEVLRYVQEATARRVHKDSLAHPLMYTFQQQQQQQQQQQLQLQVMGGKLPRRCKSLVGDRSISPYVEIRPCLDKAGRSSSTCGGGGVCAGYRNNTLQLHMTSADRSVTHQEHHHQQYHQQQQYQQQRGGALRDFISRQSSLVADRPTTLHDTVISSSSPRDDMHDHQVGRSSLSLPSGVVIHALGVENSLGPSSQTAAAAAVYSLSASLPSGVASSSRMVAMSSGVLVSQVLEKESVCLLASPAAEGKGGEEEEEGCVVECFQVWVVLDAAGGGLVLDLAVDTTHEE